MEHSLHDILEACKFLSPNINSYFEDKLYLQDVEHPEEITSIFKVKLAISLVLQELEEIGIITNLDEEEILGFQYYTKMVLALRKKFDKENLFNEIMSLDETDRHTFTYSVEECYCSTDVFIAIIDFFSNKFPLDQDWNTLSNQILHEHFTGEEDFSTYIQEVFVKVNLTDPNRSYITDDNIVAVNAFITNMADRDSLVSTMADQLLEMIPEIIPYRVNEGRLRELIEKYDKDKLAPEVLPFFAAWFVLKDKPKEEPHFLATHHANVYHHLEYWENPLRENKRISFEQACMIVFSLVLDNLNPEQRKIEVKKYFKWADPNVQDFLTQVAAITYKVEEGYAHKSVDDEKPSPRPILSKLEVIK